MWSSSPVWLLGMIQNYHMTQQSSMIAWHDPELPCDPAILYDCWIWSRITIWPSCPVWLLDMIQNTIWTAIRSSNLGNISKGNENINEKRYLHPHFQSSIMITTTVETIIDGWMDKEIVLPMYSGIMFSSKNGEILPFGTTWMDLQGVSWVQQRKTNTVLSHVFMESETVTTKRNSGKEISFAVIRGGEEGNWRKG